MSVVLAPLRSRVRHIPASWWGLVSYRNLSMTYEHVDSVCPWCGSPLHKAEYSGNRLDQRFDSYNLTTCWMPLVEDGRVVWHISDKGDSG
jgi:hypothetical protein